MFLWNRAVMTTDLFHSDVINWYHVCCGSEVFVVTNIILVEIYLSPLVMLNQFIFCI